MHLLTCPPHHPEIQGCSPQIVTNKSTNPLIQNNFALKKLEVGLVRKGAEWPQYPPARGRNSSRLILDDETFRDMAHRYSWIVPIKEARSLAAKMRLVGLPVGADNFNRCLLSPFQATSGRNQPGSSSFIVTGQVG